MKETKTEGNLTILFQISFTNYNTNNNHNFLNCIVDNVCYDLITHDIS